MIKKIIDLLFRHAKCSVCKQVDHKENMSVRLFYSMITEWPPARFFYHYKCREEKFNEKLCECGKHWVEQRKK